MKPTRPAAGVIPERDERVLEQLLRGTTKTQITHILDLMPSQVTQSIRRTFRKLGVANLVELGAWAQRNGRMPDVR